MCVPKSGLPVFGYDAHEICPPGAGPPRLARGVRKRNVVVGPAILSLKGAPPLRVVMRPHAGHDGRRPVPARCAPVRQARQTTGSQSTDIEQSNKKIWNSNNDAITPSASRHPTASRRFERACAGVTKVDAIRLISGSANCPPLRRFCGSWPREQVQCR